MLSPAGGQVGDKGLLIGKDSQFEVTDTQKYMARLLVILLKVISGSFIVNHKINAVIDVARRDAIRLNHSANAFIAYAALRQVLGTHVTQKGSLVNDKYLRFDFSPL